MKVLRNVLFVMIPILVLLTFYMLYAYGVIFKYDPKTAFYDSMVLVKIVESTDEQAVGKYFVGYFATPNKIVISAHNIHDFVFECADMDDNIYHIKEINKFDRIAVITTEEKNGRSIYYQPLPFKNDTTVCTSIGDGFEEFDIWDRRAIHDGKWFVMCKGTAQNWRNRPAVTSTGRMIGLVEKGDDESFFVYTHYEIMKEIIIHNIKEMLGLV